MTTQNSLGNTLGVTTATSIAFSPTTNGIVGTTTNDSASSGYVGEFIDSIVALASAVSCTNTTARDVTSISLTAGNWIVYGNVAFIIGGVCSGAEGWISLTSATTPDFSLMSALTSSSGVNSCAFTVPSLRVSIASTTTVYLSVVADFTTSTVTACGGIYAIRVR